MRIPPPQTAIRFCLTLLGLIITMGGAAIVAVNYHFGSFSTSSSQDTALFIIFVLVGIAFPLQLYVAVHLGRVQAHNESLVQIATRDGLTKLLNRSAFTQAATAKIAAIGDRASVSGVQTLLVIDADHFKKINDRLGHHVGDEALRGIAMALRAATRPEDVVGRLGGEEFVVLMTNSGLDDAWTMAERIRMAINALSVGSNVGRTRLSVSIGGVSFRSAVRFDALYRLADSNLYRAKQNGRNRVDLTQLGRISAHLPALKKLDPTSVRDLQRTISWRRSA
jgi:diguanylate cyclase